MKKSIIVAMSANHVIGKDNKMLWNIPEDLKKFKEITSGHHIIMGRKTYESIGRPLPNRTNIVITNNPDYIVPANVILVGSLNEALEIAEKNGEQEVFVIGGGEIYSQAINMVDTIYLTRLMDRFDGDTFFPIIDFSHWEVRDQEIERYIFKNFPDKLSYEFMIFDRK